MPLSALHVRNAGPGRHVDGRGLMLLVKASGTRSWVLRYQINGHRRDLGLGPWPEVTLAEAREKALEARRLIKTGKDPLAQVKKKVLTFEEAAGLLIESKRPGWRNAKHAAQWTATLATYVYPKIGRRDVNAVDTPAVLDVLRPIWTAKPETASRVRQRIEAVLEYASASGSRTGDNPARWKGHLDHLLAAPAKVKAVEHHAALDWREAPAFMAQLRRAEGVAARALAFLMLTAARSGEVREMRWSEIDDASGVWTIPGSRMKAGKEHRVPLTAAARELLGERGDDSSLVFGSPLKPDRPLSDMTLAAVLKRMKLGHLTVHGMRSTFRDWAGETTSHPREVIEAALAHRLKDKAEAAYARGDLFTKRRRLITDWSQFLSMTFLAQEP